MSFHLKPQRNTLYNYRNDVPHKRLFKLGSLVQLVLYVSSSKISRYGLAKMHRLNVILSSSPISQSTNLLKHIQYFVKHNVRYLISP